MRAPSTPVSSANRNLSTSRLSDIAIPSHFALHAACWRRLWHCFGGFQLAIALSVNLDLSACNRPNSSDSSETGTLSTRCRRRVATFSSGLKCFRSFLSRNSWITGKREVPQSVHKILIGHNPRKEKSAGRLPAHAPYASDLD